MIYFLTESPYLWTFHLPSVSKMIPSNDGWTYAEPRDFVGLDGSALPSNVVLDANVNLSGTSYDGGVYGCAVVWEDHALTEIPRLHIRRHPGLGAWLFRATTRPSSWLRSPAAPQD